MDTDPPQHASNDVAQVGDVVDVGQSAGDEHIALPSHGLLEPRVCGGGRAGGGAMTSPTTKPPCRGPTMRVVPLGYCTRAPQPAPHPKPCSCRRPTSRPGCKSRDKGQQSEKHSASSANGRLIGDKISTIAEHGRQACLSVLRGPASPSSASPCVRAHPSPRQGTRVGESPTGTIQNSRP